MLAAELLRLGTAEWDAARHPAPAVFSLGQRSRHTRHSRRLRLPEAVRRPALASGSQRTSALVRQFRRSRVYAPKPKSRAGSQLSLPSACLRSETAVLVWALLPVVHRPVGRPRVPRGGGC